MASTPDYARLFEGLAGLIDMINSGDAGLPSLYRLLELGQSAVGAAGMSFAEYASESAKRAERVSDAAGATVATSGRVIAATGASEWALGRPVDPNDPVVARLLAGERDQELAVDDLPPELANQLRGRGLRRMIGARAELGGVVVGSLHAYYAEPERPGSTERRTLVRWLAGCVAHLYGKRNGLPVHGDGPPVTELADGLAILASDGTVRLWNPAAERMTGYDTTDVIGAGLPMPVPEPGRSRNHRQANGQWLQITCATLPGSEARVVTIRDVSEPHRRERDRDLFIAVTSHELRTPVTVIKGYADTLTEHWDSLDEPTRRDAIRVLGQRAGELARLVDRLLSAASQADGAAGATTPVPFDLVESLRTAAERLPVDLRRSLRVELPATLPRAYGDRTSVATVLTELVTNAYKYSPASPDVCVSADADGQTVYFRVADRGVGVRPEHVERAFERFWQGESDDARRYGGVGLGLYLVRRIVERQNGWVSLRPRERGGTVAEVRLPRADLAPGEA